MVLCAIKGCTSRSDVHISLEHSLHFHRLPKTPDIRNKWAKAINRSVSEYTRVCSRHFKKENYTSTQSGLKRLLPNAIPELHLPIQDTNPSEDEQLSQFESIMCQQSAPSNVETIQQTVSNGSVKMTTIKVIGSTIELNGAVDIQENHTETDPLSYEKQYKIRTPLEKKLIKEVKRLQTLSKTRMKAIHCLEEQNRRLLKRNNFLQEALDRKGKMPEEVNNAALLDSNFFSTLTS